MFLLNPVFSDLMKLTSQLTWNETNPIKTLNYNLLHMWWWNIQMFLNEHYVSPVQRLQSKSELGARWRTAALLQIRNPAGKQTTYSSLVSGPWSQETPETFIDHTDLWWQGFGQQPMRGPGDLRHDLERRRQERLEGVKVTIPGNSLSQRPLGPAGWEHTSLPAEICMRFILLVI